MPAFTAASGGLQTSRRGAFQCDGSSSFISASPSAGVVARPWLRHSRAWPGGGPVPPQGIPAGAGAVPRLRGKAGGPWRAAGAESAGRRGSDPYGEAALPGHGRATLAHGTGVPFPCPFPRSQLRPPGASSAESRAKRPDRGFPCEPHKAHVFIDGCADGGARRLMNGHAFRRVTQRPLEQS